MQQEKPITIRVAELLEQQAGQYPEGHPDQAKLRALAQVNRDLWAAHLKTSAPALSGGVSPPGEPSGPNPVTAQSTPGGEPPLSDKDAILALLNSHSPEEQEELFQDPEFRAAMLLSLVKYSNPHLAQEQAEGVGPGRGRA